MRILRKESSDILVVASPDEEVRLGDYLMVTEKDRSLVLQVIDENYLDVDGVEEEVIREEVLSMSAKGVTEDPADLASISRVIRDMRLLHCKARGSIERDRFSPHIDWIPSRTTSKVRRLDVNELLERAGVQGERKIIIGKSGGSSPFSVTAESFDGRVTIVTGRKESGKSHLAKMLVRGLAEYGAYCIVFDLNDEYGSVGLRGTAARPPLRRSSSLSSRDGSSGSIWPEWGCGRSRRMLQHSLDMPGTSIREFMRIWDTMHAKESVSLETLGEMIQQWRCNEFVRDALYSRYYTLQTSGLFTDSRDGDFSLGRFFASHPDGGVLVVSLCRTSPLNRRLQLSLSSPSSLSSWNRGSSLPSSSWLRRPIST